jgi:hypothetical protein
MSGRPSDPPALVSVSDFRRALGGDAPRAVFDHWLAKRGLRAMPEPREIDPVEIGAEPLPHLFILDIDGADRYRFRLAGTLLPRIFGREVAGRSLEDVVPDRDLGNARRSYGLIAETARAWHSVAVYRRDGVGTVTWERLALPLGRDGVVTRILGGLFVEADADTFEDYGELYGRGGLEPRRREERMLEDR